MKIQFIRLLHLFGFTNLTDKQVDRLTDHWKDGMQIVGRYNGDRTKALRSQNITSSLVYDPSSNTFHIRCDDLENPEFWLEITIDEQELIIAKDDAEYQDQETT